MLPPPAATGCAAPMLVAGRHGRDVGGDRDEDAGRRRPSPGGRDVHDHRDRGVQQVARRSSASSARDRRACRAGSPGPRRRRRARARSRVETRRTVIGLMTPSISRVETVSRPDRGPARARARGRPGHGRRQTYPAHREPLEWLHNSTPWRAVPRPTRPIAFAAAGASAIPLYRAYHDREWGVPLHDDRRLFELLCLEGAQAGLAWITILRKRAGYRRAFDRFDPRKVAGLRSGQGPRAPRRPRHRPEPSQGPGHGPERPRLPRAPDGARELRPASSGASSTERRARTRWRSLRDVPPRTPESDALSRALRDRGFTFVGSTICYAFMQAAGLVNDHVVDCFRHPEVARLRARGGAPEPSGGRTRAGVTRRPEGSDHEQRRAQQHRRRRRSGCW